MWFIIVGSIISVAVAWFATSVALAPTPGATVENFKRVREGMEFSEVQALLGEREPYYRNLWIWTDGDISVGLIVENGCVKSGKFKRGNDYIGDVPRSSVIESIWHWFGRDRPIAFLESEKLMQKWLAITGSIVTIAIAWFALQVKPTPAPGVTVENFRRLHVDMSVEDVEAIFGPPHGKITLLDEGDDAEFVAAIDKAVRVSDWWKCGALYWRSDEFSLVLVCDPPLVLEGFRIKKDSSVEHVQRRIGCKEPFFSRLKRMVGL